MVSVSQSLKKNLSNPIWRLNHLYWIINEDSQRVKFKFRYAQQVFYDNMWYWNELLKSRQHGFSTLIDLIGLDLCLFNDNIEAGIVAHTLKDVQHIFATKIKYPYENLPQTLKDRIPATKCDANELKLANNSWLRVATSMRSSTLRWLHVSERGKMCAKYPKKAEELKTGTLPALHEGSYFFDESTADGGAGDFHDACQLAMLDTQNEKKGVPLSKMQCRFHFFAWHDDPKNATDPLGIRISKELIQYFKELDEKHDIKLTDRQMSWYALKRDGAQGLGRLIKREHPSFPTEAFEQSVEGAVYGEQLERARNEGRVGFYPWVETMPVYTFWDLGYGDATCIVFAQFIKEQVRVIDFYSMQGRGAAYHAVQVKGKEYAYGEHYFPHDIMNHEQGSGIVLKDTYDSLLFAPGSSSTVVERPKRKADGIDAVRGLFNSIVFNEPTTRDLIKALAFYRYEWDDAKVCFSKDPLHDGASHPADAMQTMAMQYRFGTIGGRQIGYPKPLPANVGMRKECSDPLSSYRVGAHR